MATPTALDWRTHKIGPSRPEEHAKPSSRRRSHRCIQGRNCLFAEEINTGAIVGGWALMRNAAGQPEHKVCAEHHAALDAQETATRYQERTA